MAADRMCAAISLHVFLYSMPFESLPRVIACTYVSIKLTLLTVHVIWTDCRLTAPLAAPC